MRPGHFAILILQFDLVTAAVAHGTRGSTQRKLFLAAGWCGVGVPAGGRAA